MLDHNYLEQLLDGGFIEINGFPLPTASDYYSITTAGKDAIYQYRANVITRVIAITALIISIFSYFKK